jgi:hypothetical protein
MQRQTRWHVCCPSYVGQGRQIGAAVGRQRARVEGQRAGMADREAGIGRRGGKARSACEKKPISLRFRDARRSYNRRNSPTAREYRAAGADEGRGDCAAATDGGGGLARRVGGGGGRGGGGGGIVSLVAVQDGGVKAALLLLAPEVSRQHARRAVPAGVGGQARRGGSSPV